jgi:hypothetical protein
MKLRLRGMPLRLRLIPPQMSNMADHAMEGVARGDSVTRRLFVVIKTIREMSSVQLHWVAGNFHLLNSAKVRHLLLECGPNHRFCLVTLPAACI